MKGVLNGLAPFPTKRVVEQPNTKQPVVNLTPLKYLLAFCFGIVSCMASDSLSSLHQIDAWPNRFTCTSNCADGRSQVVKILPGKAPFNSALGACGLGLMPN